MIGGTKIELSSMETKEFAPKTPYKDWIPVTNNGGRNTMETENGLKKDLRHLCCCIGVLQGSEVSIFGKAIDNHKNSGSAIGGR
jgi:hypothetical protein